MFGLRLTIRPPGREALGTFLGQVPHILGWNTLLLVFVPE